jgi:hypothetical protein
MHDPQPPLEHLAVIAGGASSRWASSRWALGRQEGCDPRPALLRQRWEAGKKQGSGKEIAQRCVCRGGAVVLERVAADMRLLGKPLMPPTPVRPMQMKGITPRVHALQREAAADLRHSIGN